MPSSPQYPSPILQPSANPSQSHSQPDSPLTDPDARRGPHTPGPPQPTSSPSPHPTSEEGYPSWLPKRPSVPVPASTVQSSTINMLANEASPGAGPSEMGAWGGRKPTPRSVRIVSLQDSFGFRREPTDQTAFTAAPGAPPVAHSRVWSRATGAGLSPTVFSPTVDGRLGQAQAPRFRAWGLNLRLLRDPSWRSRLHFFLFPLLVFFHVPLQTFFDFNAVFILIQ